MNPKTIFLMYLQLVLVAFLATSQFGRAAEVSLTDLDLKLIKNGASKPADKNWAFDGKPITLEGQSYTNGIGMHAPALVRVLLHESATKFKGVFGSTVPNGSIELIVMLDGKEAWRSGVLKGTDPRKNVDVDISNAKEMVLQITDGGNGANSDHACIADPMIAYEGKAPELAIVYPLLDPFDLNRFRTEKTFPKGTMPIYHLLTLEPEDVPEKVIVTELKGVGARRLGAVDIEAYILETVPKNWVNTGKGTLRVSDKYSNAGKKSIRWDWKAGDILRIKNLGILSDVTGFSTHQGGGISAPFTMSGFVDTILPENADFNMYYVRPRQESHWSPAWTKSGVAKKTRTVPAGFSGTWFAMSSHGLGDFVAEYDNFGKEIDGSDTLPDDVPTPEKHELIIQAPRNVSSGTIYLDRLIVVASKPIAEEGTPISSWIIRSPLDGISQVTPIKPIPDAFLAKIPKSLNAEQQKFIDDLRAKYFPEPSEETIPKDSPAYAEIEKNARFYLDEFCAKQADGSYKFREEFNFNGDRVYFKGDLYVNRKFHGHVPQVLSNGERTNLQHLIYTKHFGRVYDWIQKCPDSEPVKAYFKAFMDWQRYQVMDAPFVPPPGGKYGYHAGGTRKLVSLFREKPEFKEYSDYFGRLAIAGDASHWGIFTQHEKPYWGLEWPHAQAVFESMIFEQDDRKLYAMLTNYRDNWNWFYSISTPGRSGMIKPDYTYFHHGIPSYWGNFHGHIKLGETFMNTPLDFEPRIHRTLANHTIRTTLGGPVVNLKGEQQNPWWGQGGLLKQQRMEDPKYIEAKQNEYEKLNDKQFPAKTRDLAAIEQLPNNQVFQYFHNMDWNKVPAAKKYFRTVLGDLERTPQATRDELFVKYPKLKGLKPQRDIHMSFNLSGAAVYYHNQSAVACGSYKDDLFIRAAATGYSWVRQYGILYPFRRDSIRANSYLGLNPYGYDYSKVPGTTMPEIEPNLIDQATGMIDNMPAKGNGSLTFYETEESMGTCGNYAFRIYPAAGAKLWESYNVKNFQGKKSYHFFQDKVVALGSDLKADTDRPMQTVLFQEMTGVVPWVDSKNHARWNPEKPVLIHNDKTYDGPCEIENILSGSNYIVSPYGHAYLIPSGQGGKLSIEWTKRKFPISAYGNQGEKEGIGAIARMLHESKSASSHHFCLLLNSDGKPLDEIRNYARQTLHTPNYSILQQDSAAHAISFDSRGERDVYSCIVFEPDSPLEIPYVHSTNRPVNLMMQQNAAGHLVVTICDTTLAYDAQHRIEHEPGHGYNKKDPRNVRTLKIVFSGKIDLIESRSGLPESNPGLNARVEGDAKNILTFETRDAVSDTFVISLEASE